MKKTILEVNNISKRFKKRNVVKNVTFNAYEGEILGILGANGAGKTTIIKMITGLIRCDSGEVFINSYNIKTNFEEALKNISAVVETPCLYEYMSGNDNIEIFSKLYKASEYGIEQAKKLCGLNDRLNDKVKIYSLGMKQRLGIAIALLKEPKLLILDEPTNGLDPMGIKDLRDFLKKLVKEKDISIIISSHTLSEMEKLCDRVIIIREGELIGEQNIHDITPGNSLEDIFIELLNKNGGNSWI